MQIMETVAKPVTTVEYLEIVIDDEKGRRIERRPRYNVADPNTNPTRAALAEQIISRRGSAESLTHGAMAAAVSAADEFDRLKNPTISNRRHYAMCLMGAKMTREEANKLSGIDDYMASLNHVN